MRDKQAQKSRKKKMKEFTPVTRGRTGESKTGTAAKATSETVKPFHDGNITSSSAGPPPMLTKLAWEQGPRELDCFPAAMHVRAFHQVILNEEAKFGEQDVPWVCGKPSSQCHGNTRDHKLGP